LARGAIQTAVYMPIKGTMKHENGLARRMPLAEMVGCE
jgi:hypothetical protein